MNKMHKTALTTSAVLAGVLLGTATTETAHADENSDGQRKQATVTPEAQYTNAQNSNRQQLADLQKQNVAKENALQTQTTQANNKDASTVQEKVAGINQQLANANKDEQETTNQQLAQKQTTVNAAAAKQTAGENAAYQQKEQQQLAENASAVKAQEASNKQVLQNSAKLIVTPEKKAQQVTAAQQAQTKAITTINDAFNTDMANTKRAKDSAISQATTNRDQGLKNANAQKQSAIQAQQAQNAQNLAAANHAYDQAVANAPKITNAVKPATPAGMDQLSPAGKMITETEDHQLYPVATMGSWYNINTEDGQFNTNANVVSNENQLPLDFKPGILAYDPANDHSEKINGNLTDAQKQRLNDLSNQWMNSLRHQVWEQMKIQNSMSNAHVDGYSSGSEAMTVAELAPQGQLQDLITPKNYWNHVSSIIGQTREQHHTGYEHSVENAKNGTGYDDHSGSYIDTIHGFDAMDHASADIDAMNAYAENLYSVEGNTMLQFEVNLYNRMQDMLWGGFFSAISNTDSTPHLGGHLANVLNPNFKLVGMGFQNAKTDPDFDVRATGSDNQNETFYYVVWDFGGDTDGHTDQEYINTYAQADEFNEDWQAGLVNTGVINAIKSAQSDKDAKPDLNAPAVKAAAAHVDQVKADNQHALDTINAKDYQADVLAAYNTAIKQANDAYTAQVNTLTKHRDAKLQSIKDEYAKQIADIKAQPESLAALQQQLNAKLDAIKADGQAKLAALRKAHDDKLAEITKTANDELAAFKVELDKTVKTATDKRQAEANAQIAQLNAAHDALVKTNDEKLATLVASDNAAYDQLKDKLDSELTALHTKLFPQQAGNGKAVVSGKSNTLVLTGSNTTTSNAATTSVKAVLPANGNMPKSNKNSATKQAALPQTGNKPSVAALALGAVSAMFGLGLMKKREY